MKIFLIFILLATKSWGLEEKVKRDAEFFGQFQLPELPLVRYDTFGVAGGGFAHEEHNVVHHNEYASSVAHDEYGLPAIPHEEYGPPPVPHEEYGPPPQARVETTTPHYCPEEDFQSAFVPVPPEIPIFPLPEVPLIRQEVVVVPHTDYGPPTTLPPTTLPPTTLPPTTVPHHPYPPPTTTTTTTLPPPPPPPPTVHFYPYPAPTTTTTTTTTVPPPPPSPPARTYPYPPPTTTTTTTTPPPPPPITTTVAPRISKYPAKVHSKYEHTVHHHPAIISPVIRFVEPKIVVHKKVISFPLLKKKFLKFENQEH